MDRRARGTARPGVAIALMACAGALGACEPQPSGGSDVLPSVGPQGGLIEFDAAAIPDPTDAAAGGDAAAPGAPDAEGDATTIAVIDGGKTDAASDESLGGGGGSGHCSGIAEACSTRSTASCTTGYGCAVGGSCTGLAYDCFAEFADVTCLEIQGCVWDSLDNFCGGSAFACDTYTGSGSCDFQLGCSWAPSCAGTPTACSLLSDAECLLQPGCSLP